MLIQIGANHRSIVPRPRYVDCISLKCSTIRRCNSSGVTTSLGIASVQMWRKGSVKQPMRSPWNVSLTSPIALPPALMARSKAESTSST